MRAGMRGVVGALVVLATAAVGVPAASAGTYDVVSCGAPGAGGINRAWQPQYGDFTNPNTGDYVPPDPSSYDIADQCPSQLLVRSSTTKTTNAAFLRSGNWIFSPPAGNRVLRLETWRFGVRLRTNAGDPDASQGGDQGDPWRVFARDEGAQLIGGVFGENCTAPPGAIGCSFGSDTGVSNASHAVYDINAGRLAYSVSCEGDLAGCPTQYQGTPIATIKIFGTRVTVNDPTVPSLKVGGPLQQPGWHKAGESVTYDASDNSGIRAVRLDLGSRTRRDAGVCDYHLTAPCVAQRTAALKVPDGTPDGTYKARIVAEDASGNETPIARTIRVDGTPPSAGIVRTKGRRIVLKLSDPASGLAGARLEVRRHGNEAYRTLNATIKNGKLRAKVDKGKAAKLDMRLTLRDNAGNVAQGNPTRLTATRARVGHRFHNVRAGGLKLPFGRAARLRGRLTLSAGQSFAGQTIVATARVRKKGAKTAPAGTATTDRHGRFSIGIPAGPSRAYRLVFKGSGGALANARDISVRVPASSTIRASRTHISGGRVRFSGRLRSRGLRVPRGLIVVLQGREGGRWLTFEDARTKSEGRWHVAYRFSGRPGSYPIRLRIRRQARFPFELGYSRRLTIRVG